MQIKRRDWTRNDFENMIFSLILLVSSETEDCKYEIQEYEHSQRVWLEEANATVVTIVKYVITVPTLAHMLRLCNKHINTPYPVSPRPRIEKLRTQSPEIRSFGLTIMIHCQ